jgi:hypothetical protein
MGAAAPPIAVNLSEVLVSRRHRASCAPAHNNFVPLRLAHYFSNTFEHRLHSFACLLIFRQARCGNIAEILAI